MTGSKAMGGTAFSTSTYRMKQLCTECPTAERRNFNHHDVGTATTL
jgi:hypothetical protein